MAVWGANYLADGTILAKIVSVLDCVAVKGAGPGAGLLAMG